MSGLDTGGPVFPVQEAMFEKTRPGMTLRQYAAIKLRVPDSGTDWLDDMIRVSVRDEVAAKAMQGFIACPNTQGEPEGIATWCYMMADAMLKAGEV
jgi:hypothetical protein